MDQQPQDDSAVVNTPMDSKQTTTEGQTFHKNVVTKTSNSSEVGAISTDCMVDETNLPLGDMSAPSTTTAELPHQTHSPPDVLSCQKKKNSIVLPKMFSPQNLEILSSQQLQHQLL